MADINTQPLAVITGGASGIGLSAVKRFLDEGYEVKVIAKKLHSGRCSKTGKKMYEYSKDVEVKLLEDFHNIYRSKPKGNKRNSYW